MKKLIQLLLILLLFTACSSSSNDNSSSTAQSSITPPAWIQGTWATQSGSATNGYTYNPTFRFKTNDLCTILGNSENCNSGIIQQSNGQVVAQQSINDNEYKLSLISGGSTSTYNFIKINATKIEYVIGSGSPNMQLFKQ